MKRNLVGLIVAAACASGCATSGDGDAGSQVAAARAEIRDVVGRSVARAEATQLGDAVRIRIEAAGLAPGTYAAHVHTAGRCEPPDFASAGPHWNPNQRQHGTQNPQGPHLGDLPNLAVGANGEGSLEFSIPRARLNGGAQALLDGDGASVMIHANPDDYRTDPSGNSGSRIACGLLS